MPWVKDVTTPFCEVEFHTEEKLYKTVASHSPSDDLLSVNTTKNISSSSPAGSFVIELVGRPDKNGKTWYDKIHSQDMVVIKMGRKAGNLDTVMVGLVDEVRRVTKVGSKGERTVRIKIKGRDWAKALLKAEIKWFPQFFEDDKVFPIGELTDPAYTLLQMKAFYAEMSGMGIGTPAFLIEQTLTRLLFKLMLFKVVFWESENDKKFATIKEILRFRLTATKNLVPFMVTMNKYEGSIWNFLTSIQNPPFFELFVDTRTDFMECILDVELDSYDPPTRIPKKYGEFPARFGDDEAAVVLFLRRTPFDKEDWNNLYTHHIESDEIIDEDIGRGDHENYNMFHASPALTLIKNTVAHSAIVKPLYNADNIAKYGLSFLEKQVEGIYSQDENPENPLSVTAIELTKTLKEWYENNLNYENGTVVLKGKGDIKVGQRFHNVETNTVFYIESVTQNFVNFENWSTSLDVTRGQFYTDIKTVSPIVSTIPTTKQETTASVEEKYIYYTVVKGDTLWGIATRYYGKGQDWKKIYEANRDIIAHPDLIYPGQRFKIVNPIKEV